MSRRHVGLEERTFAGRNHKVVSVLLEARETKVRYRPRVTVASQWQVLARLWFGSHLVRKLEAESGLSQDGMESSRRAWVDGAQDI